MKRSFSLCLPALLLFLSGCASLREGAPQDVVVLSYPSGADVIVNGKEMGVTPLKLSLPRKSNHEVRIEKEGYNPAVKYFTPAPTDDGTRLVRFGLMEDMGYYHELEPRTMRTQLRSDLVPASAGPDPFERMAQQALEADKMLEQGKISAEEHKYIVEQIIAFFEGQE